MTDLPREDLLTQLRDLADRRNRSVDEMMEELLAPYQQELRPEPFDPDNPPPGTLAALAKAAREAGLYAEVDTSERSREILKTEYAEHLKKKMRREQHDDSDR